MPHKFIVDDHVDITEITGTHFAQRMIKHPIQNETLKEKMEILSDFISEHPSINIDDALSAYRSIIELIADINESQETFDDFIQQILEFEVFLRCIYQDQTRELLSDESNLQIYQKIMTQNDEFYLKMFDETFMNSILNKEKLSHFEFFCICHYLQHVENISKELFEALSLKFISYFINLMKDAYSESLNNLNLFSIVSNIDTHHSIRPSFDKTIFNENFLHLVKSHELFSTISKKIHELVSVPHSICSAELNNLILNYYQSLNECYNKLTRPTEENIDFDEIPWSEDQEPDHEVTTLPSEHPENPTLKNKFHSVIHPVIIYARTDSSWKNDTSEINSPTDEETTQLYSRDGLDVYPMVVDERYKLSFEQSGENEIHRASLTVDYTEIKDPQAFVIINMIENILAHGKGRLNITTNHLESALIADAYFQKLILINDAFDDIIYRNPLAKNAPTEMKEQYMQKIERY